MSQGRAFETVVGIAVVVVAAGFLTYAYQVSDRNLSGGAYPLEAVFGRVDGVSVGSDVRIAGVKVGAVSGNQLDPSTYEAKLRLSIARDVSIPEDSVAKIVSDSLLGGAHISIEPGASDIYLAAGEAISFTQGSVDLLGLAVQSLTSGAVNAAKDAPAPDAGAEPVGSGTEE